ncbi:hypothetical protein M885DRAFT_528327 [Pelagophyceae sp. CCMP2097]|nr:hypothetical protein M885DRAFT_528327 [Pelagophyceae sp. CCMP2097]
MVNAALGLQLGARRRAPRRSTQLMVRNRDRPELLIVVGRECQLHADGLARLAREAAEVQTPTVWLDHADGAIGEDALLVMIPAAQWDADVPRPTVLQRCRESFDIEPDAFGGSDGFGANRRPQPRRQPLACRCVVLSTSREAIVAGRAAGMRAVGLVASEDVADVADVWFDDLDAEAATFDDFYTPGSFWANPAVPRTVEGLHADAWTGEVTRYDGFDQVSPPRPTERPRAEGAQGDAELRAILDGLAPPRGSPNL